MSIGSYVAITAIVTASFVGPFASAMAKPQGMHLCKAEIKGKYVDIGRIQKPGATFITKGGENIQFVGFVSVDGDKFTYNCRVESGAVTLAEVFRGDEYFEKLAELK